MPQLIYDKILKQPEIEGNFLNAKEKTLHIEHFLILEIELGVHFHNFHSTLHRTLNHYTKENRNSNRHREI